MHDRTAWFIIACALTGCGQREAPAPVATSAGSAATSPDPPDAAVVIEPPPVDAAVPTALTLAGIRAMLGTAQTVATLEASVADFAFRADKNRTGGIIGTRDDNASPTFVDLYVSTDNGRVIAATVGTPSIVGPNGIKVGETYKRLRGITGLKCGGIEEADVSEMDCTDPADNTSYTLDKYYDKIPDKAPIRSFMLRAAKP